MKTKKSCIRIQLVIMPKSICQILYRKSNRSRKNGEKCEKVPFKILSHVVYGKAMENLRSRIDVKLVNKEEDYLPWTSKPSYESQKIFDNDLVAIHKDKYILTLNKTRYVVIISLKKSSLQIL